MNQFRKPEVKAIISVDGQIVPFISLKLHQEMSAHHHFELLLDHKTFDKQFFQDSDKRLKLVNSKVIIDLQHGDDAGKAYVFSGIVTHVRLIAAEGDHGYLLLEGASNTIELERGRISQTYSQTDLPTILREVTGGCPNLGCEIIPAWKADIDFALQFEEDDWIFLQRICKQYNERYYYTGLDLYVGPHPEFPVVNLTYDKELSTFEMCSRLRANQYSEYYYQRESHATLRQDSPDEIEGAGSTLQQVGKRMNRITTARRPNVPVAAYVPDMGSLIEQSNRRKVSTGAEMMYVRGVAKTCDVRIGRLVRIKMAETAGGADMGVYRVYKVMHELDQNGRYHCDFEALPADLEYLPTPEVPIPTPNPIECEVIRNEDPFGIGRIQVMFPFDERPCTAWIPVMTPSAGGNGQGLGPVNRGFTMIPEVSDSVLVSFLDGATLSQPVVIGSMFHGKNAATLGGGKGNHIKTIITRSGAKIVFNDEYHSIHIEDPSRNIIDMDGRGQISINAPEKIILNSKEVQINGHNVEINTTNNLLISVGNNLIQNALNMIHSSAAYMKQIIDDYVHLFSKTTLISSKDNLKMQSEEINALGLGKLLLHSDKAIMANSLGYMNLKSTGNMNLAQDAQANKPANHEEIALAIANFRPSSTYKGEFGFDWYRIGLGSYPRDIQLLRGGHGFNRQQAQLAYMKEFRPIPIKRPQGVQNNEPDQQDYYVSFLNIYPEAVSKAAVDSIAPLVYKVTLRLFVEVLKPIDKLEVEYDTNYFSFDNDIIATCLTPGKYTYYPEITCKDAKAANVKNMGHITEKEIRVWAYPDESTQKPKTEQLTERKLAGKLVALPNDKAYRKQLKVVYVSVLTNTRGTNPTSAKALPGNMKEHLSRSLHQALIDCTVETGPDLDLSADNNFKAGGQFLDAAKNIYATLNKVLANEELYTYLKKQYDAEHPEYANHFQVFYIGTDSNKGLAGQVKKIGDKSVLLFKDYETQTEGVLSHEVFHGLGLGHSFQNPELPISPEQTYVFLQEQTKNIMDYTDTLLDSWRWQWKKINPNAN